MIMEINGETLFDIAKSADSIGRDDILLKLKQDRWLTMVKGVSNTCMFAARIPEESMKSYDTRGEKELAIKSSKIIDFSPPSNSTVKLEYKDHDFMLSDGEYTMTTSAIDRDYVEGSMQNTIDTEWPVSAVGCFDEINSFIKKAKSIVGEAAFIMGAREDGLYLMSKKDDDELHTRIEWDDFDEVDNDWAKADNAGAGEQKVDSLFSIDFYQNLHFPSEASEGFRINMGDNKPLRVISQMSGGGGLVYILTPRIATESTDSIMEVPERVTSQY